MPELSPRRWRAILQPSSLIITALALAVVVSGTLIRDPLGVILIGLGACVLLAAVALPLIREVEFGFATGMRVSTALRERDQELRVAFQHQKGDLGLYSQLMCDDPAFATQLLESAWARTASSWRGPVTPSLRTTVLAEFVQLLTTHSRWKRFASPTTGVPAAPPLSSALSVLPVTARIVMVLREFADLPLAQIASLTKRPLAEVASDLRTAYAVLAEQGTGT